MINRELQAALIVNLKGETLLAKSESKYILLFDIAYLSLFAGNKERALDCFEKSFEMHDPNICYSGRPTYGILCDEPRCQDLFRKMNLLYELNTVFSNTL